MTDWIPIALSDGAESGRVIATSARGQELAIWRDSSGAAHVWRDRCPHRGMRLSLGFVRGDQLGCPYHGWRFASDGRCAFVPAHPDLVMPATVSAQPLLSRERAALIWVDLDGDDDTGGESLAPAGPFTGVRSVLIHAPIDAVASGLAEVTLLSWPEPAEANWQGRLASYRDGQLLIGAQPLDEARTALHLCSPATASVAFRVELAELAARLRDRQLVLR